MKTFLKFFASFFIAIGGLGIIFSLVYFGGISLFLGAIVCGLLFCLTMVVKTIVFDE